MSPMPGETGGRLGQRGDDCVPASSETEQPAFACAAPARGVGVTLIGDAFYLVVPRNGRLIAMPYMELEDALDAIENRR